MAGTIHFVADAGIATVTLESPGKLNAVNVAMWQELRRVFEALAGDDGVRCIVVRGAGGNFAAGADLDEFGEVHHDVASGRRFHLETVVPSLAAIRDVRQPVLAAIEGVCAGGGLQIALACDIRIAADNARFGVPVGRLGLPVVLPELRLLLERLGQAVTAELLLTGRLLDAMEARDKGIVSRAVPAADFEQRVGATAHAIAARLTACGAQQQGADSPARRARHEFHGARSRLELRVPGFRGLSRRHRRLHRQTPPELHWQMKNQNLYALIESRMPRDLAAVCLETPDGLVYSYRDLHFGSARIAGWLSSLGLTADVDGAPPRIAAQVEKSPEALFLYLAALRAGHVFLPLNTGYRRPRSTTSSATPSPPSSCARPPTGPGSSRSLGATASRTSSRWATARDGTLLEAAAGPPTGSAPPCARRPISPPSCTRRAPPAAARGRCSRTATCRATHSCCTTSGAGAQATCCCTRCRSSTCTGCSWPRTGRCSAAAR